MPKKPLSEQVMVVTGASSGVGRAIARAAGERGAKVVVADVIRNPVTSAETALIRELQGPVSRDRGHFVSGKFDQKLVKAKGEKKAPAAAPAAEEKKEEKKEEEKKE